ncbi:JAB domain-containing protein [Trichlorobacter sp.]|uniref:JAB domain-containing protein n=1 Tax=Trichlorobacter sp. TaxID=2911007 RepID=UPI0032C24656
MQKLKVVRTGCVEEPEVRYTSPCQICDRFSREMMALDRECFIVLHLDGKNRIVARELVSVGSLQQSIVHPREVFKGAVLNGSASIICLHNHPSGDPKPSPEDLIITKRLQEAGEILGIKVLDHLIIGDRSAYSIISKELMKPTTAKKQQPVIVPRPRRKAGNRPAMVAAS